MSAKKHLLVARFSAMGDVLLLYPVLKSLLLHHAELEITLLTRKQFTVFFEGVPRLHLIGVDFKNEYKGIKGLYRLYVLLKKEPFEAFLDLHESLRTRVLKLLFGLSGKKCLTYQKDRKSKKALTRPNNKQRQNLLHTTERYLAVFAQLGFKASLEIPLYFEKKETISEELSKFLTENQLNKAEDTTWIGIAPFAQHENKIWGIEKVKQLIDLLLQNPDKYKIFLFGGGSTEKEILQSLATPHPSQVYNLAGQMSLASEVQLMQKLTLMLAMDSANMHLASLAGISVFSIWGATHPSLGFAPLYQPENHLIQLSLETMPCRPCSVYGNKACLRGDKACMEQISARQVFEKIKQF